MSCPWRHYFIIIIIIIRLLLLDYYFIILLLLDFYFILFYFIVELEFIFGGVGEKSERNIYIEKDGEGVGLIATYVPTYLLN